MAKHIKKKDRTSELKQYRNNDITEIKKDIQTYGTKE